MATDARVQLKKQKFLENYQAIGTITGASKAVGICRTQHYDWLKNDETYAEAFAQAEHSVADMLEEEAIRRAVQGVERPVYQGGKLVGMVQDYSDTLLIFLMKGLKPDRYQQRTTVEVKQQDAGALVEQARAKVLQFLPGGVAGGNRG